MLDKNTKLKIDELRQILVGKITDPRSQVEQITNGLLYKFMNDMDQHSISLGGNPSYFTKDYKKYSWDNLINPKISGPEKVNLYSEAIEKFYFNEDLPENFREIFKNSTLPFKEPSIFLKFIKGINFFSYSNSEKLGDAFEYLLSFMGKQGEAGQFRTPRHIIDFVVQLIDPKKNETILDPASGTAGFLISAYKQILKTNTKKSLGDLLNHTDRVEIAKNLNGYDISPEFLKVSLMNMFLHKFNDPKIFEYDTLSSEEKWNEYFDIILANPPFFSPKGGINPHNRFSIKSKRAEVLFTDYIDDHLKPSGRAGIIVPEGIIFRNDAGFKTLRSKLIKNSLIGVISLPVGVFLPYSNVKTSILILDKQKSKKNDFIFFAKVKDDGFTLNTSRTTSEKNDLPILYEKIKNNNYDDESIIKKIKKKDIKDANIRDHIAELVESESNFQFFNLGDIAEVSSGNSAPQDKKDYKNGVYPFIRTSDVGKIRFGKISSSKDYLNENAVKKLKLFKKGTILFPKSGASTLLNHRVIMEMDSYVSSHLATIKGDDTKVLDKYLLFLLNRIDTKELVPNPSYPSLNLEAIKDIQIPVPELQFQKDIVKKLENFQNVIDGCNQIIKNFKIEINYEDNFEKVKLGDVCKFSGGTQPPKATFINEPRTGYIRLLQIRDFKDDKFATYIPIKEKHKKCENKDIMIGRYGPPVFQILRGMTGAYNVALIKCIPDNNKITNDWLYYFLTSDPIQKKIISLSERARQSGVRPDDLNELEIPIPNLEIQNKLCEIANIEMNTINHNKELIKSYRSKIVNLIDEIFKI